MFFGGTDAEAETPILWPPDAKNWLFGKDPDAGKDEGRIGTTEDEMVGCHHQLNGYKFEQALGVGDGQGSLACCSPWGNKELDMTDDWTDWLNPLSITLFANVFSWSVFVFPLFIFILVIYFAVQKLLNLIICPIQTSGLWTSRPVHREAWCTAIHGFTKSQTWLNDWYVPFFNFYFSLPYSEIWIKKHISENFFQSVFCVFPSKSFMMSGHTFRSLFHFELFLLYGV